MNMPGFTAELALSRTNNHYRLGADGSFLSNGKRSSLETKSAVVPAQVNWQAVLRGGERRSLVDRPVCPIGEQAVWVEGQIEKECEAKRPFKNLSTMRWELRTVKYPCGWEFFRGWKCQSAFRVAT